MPPPNSHTHPTPSPSSLVTSTIHSCLALDMEIGCVAISPDGRWCATVCGRVCYVWNTVDFSLYALLNRPGQNLHTAPIRTIAFSPDGRHLITSGDDTKLIVWSLLQKRAARVMVGHKETVHHIVFHDEPKSASNTNNDAGTAAASTTSLSSVSSLATSTLVYSCSADGYVIAWDWSRGKCMGTVARESSAIKSIAVVHYDAGSRLLCACSDGSLAFWDLASHRRLGVISPDSEWATSRAHATHVGWMDPQRQHSGALWGCAVSPNRMYLATASSDATVKLWNILSLRRDTDTMLSQSTLQPHHAPTYIAEHTDEISLDGEETPLDVGYHGTLMYTLRHESGARHAVFTSDSELVCTAACDATVKIWITQTGAQVYQINLPYPVQSMSLIIHPRMPNAPRELIPSPGDSTPSYLQPTRRKRSSQNNELSPMPVVDTIPPGPWFAAPFTSWSPLPGRLYLAVQNRTLVVDLRVRAPRIGGIMTIPVQQPMISSTKIITPTDTSKSSASSTSTSTSTTTSTPATPNDPHTTYLHTQQTLRTSIAPHSTHTRISITKATPASQHMRNTVNSWPPPMSMTTHTHTTPRGKAARWSEDGDGDGDRGTQHTTRTVANPNVQAFPGMLKQKAVMLSQGITSTDIRRSLAHSSLAPQFLDQLLSQATTDSDGHTTSIDRARLENNLTTYSISKAHVLRVISSTHQFHPHHVLAAMAMPTDRVIPLYRLIITGHSIESALLELGYLPIRADTNTSLYDPQDTSHIYSIRTTRVGDVDIPNHIISPFQSEIHAPTYDQTFTRKIPPRPVHFEPATQRNVLSRVQAHQSIKPVLVEQALSQKAYPLFSLSAMEHLAASTLVEQKRRSQQLSRQPSTQPTLDMQTSRTTTTSRSPRKEQKEQEKRGTIKRGLVSTHTSRMSSRSRSTLFQTMVAGQVVPNGVVERVAVPTSTWDTYTHQQRLAREGPYHSQFVREQHPQDLPSSMSHTWQNRSQQEAAKHVAKKLSSFRATQTQPLPLHQVLQALPIVDSKSRSLHGLKDKGYQSAVAEQARAGIQEHLLPDDDVEMDVTTDRSSRILMGEDYSPYKQYTYGRRHVQAREEERLHQIQQISHEEYQQDVCMDHTRTNRVYHIDSEEQEMRGHVEIEQKEDGGDTEDHSGEFSGMDVFFETTLSGDTSMSHPSPTRPLDPSVVYRPIVMASVPRQYDPLGLEPAIRVEQDIPRAITMMQPPQGSGIRDSDNNKSIETVESRKAAAAAPVAVS